MLTNHKLAKVTGPAAKYPSCPRIHQLDGTLHLRRAELHVGDATQEAYDAMKKLATLVYRSAVRRCLAIAAENWHRYWPNAFPNSSLRCSAARERR